MQYFLLTCVVFFLCPGMAMAKKKRKPDFTTQDVIHASDSLLSSKMGDSLFRFCRYDKSSYFTYRKGKNSRFTELIATDKLPKSFEQAYIRYEFLMPYPECPLYDTITGIISVAVRKEDTVFSFVNEPDISLIPAMAAKHEPCGFISEEDAISFAFADTIKRGVTTPYAVLRYIPASRTFSWAVLSLLWDEKDFGDEREARKDVVIIDAISGDILRHTTIPYTQDVAEIY